VASPDRGAPLSEEPAASDRDAAYRNPVGYCLAAGREAYAIAEDSLRLRLQYAQLEAENQRLKKV
jgi:hypothetical protein